MYQPSCFCDLCLKHCIQYCKLKIRTLSSFNKLQSTNCRLRCDIACAGLLTGVLIKTLRLRDILTGLRENILQWDSLFLDKNISTFHTYSLNRADGHFNLRHINILILRPKQDIGFILRGKIAFDT